MSQSDQLLESLDGRARRREDRRAFFTAALSAAAVGAGAFAFASPAAAQTVTDADVLNFALNLEYLEANFYYYAVFGTAIPAASQGTSPGAITGGAKVNFTDPLVAQYAREIAADELAHVNFLRGALGTSAVVQPAINISGDVNGAFSAAAQAAGVVPAGTAFNPYASDEAFLLGAFIFEDVGVTAYKGAAPLLTNKTFLEAAAGILAVEAYHAAIVRTVLYRKGIETPSAQLIETTEKISAARDSLDGAPAEDATRGIAPDDDQGILPSTSSAGTVSNIAPLNMNGLAYSRSAAQTLNIVYLNRAAVTMGGFFPAGVNGTIKTSAAN
ncbi:ferritin-like domain-containing protein [Sphingomonas radiodurans]|uniref:ferritin-like domain-containing protein n=1 Tax=Sphingomonas radiodurans TaxID=2890321 RepID=UPI001E5B39A6|nr:ferritin-like domain-containing protein [Sphingomonas radiodurans]WBH15619.1 ferritin-like domain-containing protein [Sphingomonas radiodurans]